MESDNAHTRGLISSESAGEMYVALDILFSSLFPHLEKTKMDFV